MNNDKEILKELLKARREIEEFQKRLNIITYNDTNITFDKNTAVGSVGYRIEKMIYTMLDKYDARAFEEAVFNEELAPEVRADVVCGNI